MPNIDTTKLRREWIEQTLEELGTISRFAERMDVNPSTAARWIEPGKEATGRFIGSVLNNFAVDFDDVFITVREEAPASRIRLRRRVTA